MECALATGTLLVALIKCRNERVQLDCCTVGCLCPLRLKNQLLRPSSVTAYRSATGSMHKKGDALTLERCSFFLWQCSNAGRSCGELSKRA